MKSYKKYFRKAIRNKYPGNFDRIVTEIESNYKAISVDTKFEKTSINPLDKRIDFCGYFLALIETPGHKLSTFKYKFG